MNESKPEIQERSWDEIVEDARIEYLGPCTRYNGHEDGKSILFGLFFGVVMAVFAGLISNDIGYNKGKKVGYQEGHQDAVLEEPAATWAGKIHVACLDNQQRKFRHQNIEFELVPGFGSTAVYDYRSCTFTWVP